MPDPKDDILHRIVSDENGCWNWSGRIDRDGYGRSYFARKTISSHRHAYLVFRGAIPEGLQIDHVCRNRRCCNPAHLEAVTAKENTLRGTSFSAVNSRKTQCVHGHSFEPRNTYTQGGRRRQCRKCNAHAVRRYKARVHPKSFARSAHGRLVQEGRSA